MGKAWLNACREVSRFGGVDEVMVAGLRKKERICFVPHSCTGGATLEEKGRLFSKLLNMGYYLDNFFGDKPKKGADKAHLR